MIRNYLTVAWRSLLRNKLYSSINVIGLSIGISACLILFLIVNFELSFDTFHKDNERIYRVYTTWVGFNPSVNRGVTSPLPLAARNDISGIEYAVPIQDFSAEASAIDDKSREKKTFGIQRAIAITDDSYFQVFNSYRWIAGVPESALSKPFQVVLTESKVRTYFNLHDPSEAIGKEVYYQDSLVLTVTGVVEDISSNTDLDFTDFISISTIEKSWLANTMGWNSWGGVGSSSQFFVKVMQGVSPAQIGESLSKLYAKHFKGDENKERVLVYRLQPLADLHFNSGVGIFDHSSRSAAHLPTIRILGGVAIILLLIAAINFVNLETAQAMRRAREVGIRKVLGSTRFALTFQFLMQSFFLTLAAIVISIPLTITLLNVFKEFIPPGLTFDIANPFLILFLFVTLIIVSFIAGFYPAFSLSSYLPVLALKNQVIASSQTQSGFVRQSLIVFQFTFAQAFIVVAIVVGSQIKFLLNKDLGFSKDAVVYFYAPSRAEKSKKFVLKDELERIPSIKGISLCQNPPVANGWSTSSFYYNDGTTDTEANVFHKYGDSSFLSVFDIKLLAGRNLQKSDSVREFLINESFAKELGFQRPEDAIDKMIGSGKKGKYPIVGVVKDFNFQSLHNAIKPAAIANEEWRFNCFGLKLATMNGEELHQALDNITTSFKKVYPDNKIEIKFLDETIEQFYLQEQRTAKLVNAATIMAIIISCLGLFGLASFTAIQRTKEIGIRKVLGATVNNIVTLLSKEFIRLVMIAFIVAGPVSYFAAKAWLEKFPYKTDIGFSIYGWTILSAFVIVLLSVSYQAVKAALADPVESLRYE